MPTPNNVYKYSRRVKVMVIEDVYQSESEAEKRMSELKALKEYDLVSLKSFRVGAKPNKHNGFKQYYNYAVRAYKKP